MGLFDNWFLRGAQSAVFYYVSCAPCVERARMKKAKGDARRQHRERAALELQGLHPYQDYEHQPPPFSTNPYWESEASVRPKTADTAVQNNDDDDDNDDGAIVPLPCLRARPDEQVWAFEYTTTLGVDDRVTPDLNRYTPPANIYPAEDVRGSLWHRQPPPARDFMDNRAGAVNSTLAINPPLTLAARSRSRNSLRSPAGGAVSRTSTMRTTTRDAVPANALDDEYAPLRPPQDASSQGTSSTVVHTSPAAQPAPMDLQDDDDDDDLAAYADDSDADSGVDIDTLPSPRRAARTTHTKSKPTSKPRGALPRLATAPGRPTKYAYSTKTTHVAAPEQDDFWRAALANIDDSDFDIPDLLAHDGDDDEMDDGDHDDPRWHFQSGRRWSADL